jgi:hypothetical protein
MGWERRGNGLYYYSKRKVGGRVISTYHGAGPMAEAIAAGHEYLRARSSEERVERDSARRAVDEFAGLVDEFSRLTRAATRAVLLSRGCYEHKRQWRRPRKASARSG